MPVILAMTVVCGGAFYDASRAPDTGKPTGLSDPQETFLFAPGDTTRPPSLERLDERICIGTTCTNPTWRYSLDSDDATASAVAPWVYGDGLNLAGSGSAPTVPAASDGWGSPLLGASTVDGGTLFNAGKCYQAAASSSGDLTTQDAELTLLVQYSGAAGVILEKRSGAGLTIDATTSVIRAVLSDGTDSATISTATLTAGYWYLLQLYADKSGSGQWYVNHAASGSAVSLASVDSLTNSGKLTIGCDSALANGYSARVAYASLHAATLTSHLNDTLAATRFYSVTGTKALCRGNCIPIANTHDEGFVRKYIAGTGTTYFATGAGWPRVEINATSRGMLNERTPNNLLTQSEAACNAAWTKLDAGDTCSDDSASMTVPVQSGVISFGKGDGYIPDTSNGDHGATAAAVETQTQDTSFSVFVKPGSHNCIYLEDTTAGSWTYFDDLAACAACTPDGVTDCPAAIGSQSVGNLGAYAHNTKGGVCRVDIQTPGTAATHTMRWQICDADGDKTITGDGSTVALYVWGFQVSHFADHAQSPVRTAGAAVSKASGSLVFDTSSIASTTGSLVCDWWRPDANDNSSDNEYVLRLSDGTTANYLGFGVSGNDTLELLVVSASSTVVNGIDLGTDLRDGLDHSMAVTYATNSYAGYLDGTSLVTDTAGTMPSTPQMVIGGGIYSAGAATATIWNGLIKRCCVFSQKGRTSC